MACLLKTLEMFRTRLECHHVSDGSQVPDSHEPSVRLVLLQCLLSTWPPHLVPKHTYFSFTDSDGIFLASPAHFLKSQYVTAFRFLFFLFLFFFFNFYFTFKLYNIVLVLPNIEMNLPQVYPRSPSWTLLPPLSPTLPLGRPSAPAPSIQYRASNLDWRLVSYMILYMFQCYSPKSPHPLPLPQSP